MDATTITISLPAEIARDIERIANQRNVSIDTLMTEMLSQFVQFEANYVAAKADHFSILARNFNLNSNVVESDSFGA